MVTALSSRGCSCYIGAQNYDCRRKTNLTKTSWDVVKSFRFSARKHVLTAAKNKPFLARVDDGFTTKKPEGEDEQSNGNIEGKDFAKREDRGINSEILRKSLERMVSSDDSSFSGVELATLIRKKFGRSYDVQLIKKEFMGRNLLALNVMWKYMEQRSFPLTEEEYLLRLDDVANTLKCWGAVSHIRTSLVNLKERPRIGKAVSIFIDMDESGGRSNEWIYK